MRIYKISLIALIALYCATMAAAQADYHKVEVSAGYSHLRAGGLLGEGELFSDDPDQPLEAENVEAIFSTGTVTSGSALFSSSPFVHNRKRGRPGFNGFNAAAVYNVSKYIGLKFEMSGHYRSNEVSTATVYGLSAYDIPSRALLPLQPSYPAGTIRAILLFGSPELNSRQTHYNYLGGVQIKNNSKEKRFKPFAQVLAGVSRQSIEFEGFTQRELSIFGKEKFTNTGFTMAMGGGIDVRLNNRIDLRLIQVDYNPVKIGEQQILAFQQAITNHGLQNSTTFSNIATSPLYSNNDIRISSRWQHNFRIGVGIVFH